MAWSTSACLCARPILWEFGATQMKTAKFLFALLRRAASRWHPSFAFAAPLAALGFLAPLLPPGLTATLLLAAGAALAMFSIRPAPVAGLPRRAMATLAANAQRSTAAVKTSEIVLERQRPAGLAAKPRNAPEQKDRNWAELMARVNHDLRTPLNAVIGFSELMALELYGPLGDERYQDYVHHIRDSATDLLKSAEDTLALTALMTSPGRREGASACDLAHLAADAWAFVERKAAGRAISFEPCIPSSLEVLGEPRALRQVLVNLLSEAVARAGRGERVILAAVTEGELIEVALSVSRERPGAARKGSTLPICLARTLLEMQGTSLLEVDGAAHGWRAVTVLDRAVQPDFFMDPFCGEARERVAALLS
jgi:signal transduction histidine kinase